MPVSDAQKRATKKYRSEKMKQIAVTFSPVDADIYEYLCTKDSKAGYLKQLLREDMEKNS